MSPKDSPKILCRSFQARVVDELCALGAARLPVVVAVSGGPDSTAMLHALAETRRMTRVELTAAHANHALRGEESEADERFVRELCERMEIKLVCQRLPVPKEPGERSEGIEETARGLRHAFLLDVARASGARHVATAHTADDQAETVLHRILRGTGLAGLTGIPRSRSLAPDVLLIRPMLALQRAEVLEYLAAIAQDFREDRSNRDLNFTRNRVRHELLPYLAEHFNPQVTEAITRLGGLAAEAQALIDQQIRRLRRRAVVERQPQRVVLDAAPLRRAGRYLTGELLRTLWAEQSWPLQEVGQDHLERIADLATGKATARHLPAGIRASRVRDRIVLERTEGSRQ